MTKKQRKRLRQACLPRFQRRLRLYFDIPIPDDAEEQFNEVAAKLLWGNADRLAGHACVERENMLDDHLHKLLNLFTNNLADGTGSTAAVTAVVTPLEFFEFMGLKFVKEYGDHGAWTPMMLYNNFFLAVEDAENLKSVEGWSTTAKVYEDGNLFREPDHVATLRRIIFPVGLECCTSSSGVGYTPVELLLEALGDRIDSPVVKEYIWTKRMHDEVVDDLDK